MRLSALWWWWSVSSARVSWPQSSLPVSARRALSPPFSQPAVLPIVLSACRSLHRCWPNLYRPFAQHGAVSVPQHITFALLPFPVLPRVNISRRRRPLLSLWPLRRRYCCCQYRVLALRRCRLRLAPRGCPRLRCGASLTPPGPHPPFVLPGPRRRSALAARAIAARSRPRPPLPLSLLPTPPCLACCCRPSLAPAPVAAPSAVAWRYRISADPQRFQRLALGFHVILDQDHSISSFFEVSLTFRFPIPARSAILIPLLGVTSEFSRAHAGYAYI